MPQARVKRAVGAQAKLSLTGAMSRRLQYVASMSKFPRRLHKTKKHGRSRVFGKLTRRGAG